MDDNIDELLDYGEDNIHSNKNEENVKNNMLNDNNNKDNDNLSYFDNVEVDEKLNKNENNKNKNDFDIDDLLDSDQPRTKDFGVYYNSKKIQIIFSKI